MKELRDRSAEVMVASGRLEIWCHDFCSAFEQDAGRLFSCWECWYCKYGCFGINSENPTKTGICKYPEHKKSL